MGRKGHSTANNVARIGDDWDGGGQTGDGWMSASHGRGNSCAFCHKYDHPGSGAKGGGIEGSTSMTSRGG